ncbi:MAG: ATP synthase F1 subunit epsilon [Calditrichia bacterium]
MDGKTFTVEITTPQKKWQYENVKSCTAPGTKGSFQVLYNHAPLISQLEVGAIKLETTEGTILFATSGGFTEVLNNHMSFLLETCEKAQDIDTARAEQAARRARERLKSDEADVDETRARAALARAVNRIHVAGKTV